jgi:hypothetical protein
MKQSAEEDEEEGWAREQKQKAIVKKTELASILRCGRELNKVLGFERSSGHSQTEKKGVCLVEIKFRIFQSKELRIV